MQLILLRATVITPDDGTGEFDIHSVILQGDANAKYLFTLPMTLHFMSTIIKAKRKYGVLQ